MLSASNHHCFRLLKPRFALTKQTCGALPPYLQRPVTHTHGAPISSRSTLFTLVVRVYHCTNSHARCGAPISVRYTGHSVCCHHELLTPTRDGPRNPAAPLRTSNPRSRRCRYSEKNVGYIAVSLLLRSGDTMMTLVINSIRNDLNSHSSPAQVK